MLLLEVPLEKMPQPICGRENDQYAESNDRPKLSERKGENKYLGGVTRKAGGAWNERSRCDNVSLSLKIWEEINSLNAWKSSLS